jgi:hypothetical protein
MSDNFSISADVPSKILDIVVDSLNKVGIRLPPFILQCFLFILALIALLLIIHKFVKDYRAGEKKKLKNPMLIITAAGLCLILFGITFTWLEQLFFPLPDEIRGRVEIVGGSQAPTYGDLKVYVLGFKDRELGEGRVDSRNGRFGVYWKTIFGVRPRNLKVIAPGCEEHFKPLEYHFIRKSEVEIRFECKKSA